MRLNCSQIFRKESFGLKEEEVVDTSDILIAYPYLKELESIKELFFAMKTNIDKHKSKDDLVSFRSDLDRFFSKWYHSYKFQLKPNPVDHFVKSPRRRTKIHVLVDKERFAWKKEPEMVTKTLCNIYRTHNFKPIGRYPNMWKDPVCIMCMDRFLRLMSFASYNPMFHKGGTEDG